MRKTVKKKKAIKKYSFSEESRQAKKVFASIKDCYGTMWSERGALFIRIPYMGDEVDRLSPLLKKLEKK